MTLEWTGPARADLARIWTFNAARNADHAARIEDALIAGAAGLITSPRKGRPGEIEGTRELSLPGAQYVLVYQISAAGVIVLRVWSTAERRR